jgi:hypothetical protein
MKIGINLYLILLVYLRWCHSSWFSVLCLLVQSGVLEHQLSQCLGLFIATSHQKVMWLVPKGEQVLTAILHITATFSCAEVTICNPAHFLSWSHYVEHLLVQQTLWALCVHLR